MQTLFIDSRDRTSSSPSAGNFTVELPQTLNMSSGQRWRATDLRVPQVIPTIRAGINDTLTTAAIVGTITSTIPAGNYDGPGLAAVIQATLRASSAFPWVVTYDSSHMTLTFSNTTSFQIVGGTYFKQLAANGYDYTPTSWTFKNVSVLGCDVFYLCSPVFQNLDTYGPKGASDVMMIANITTGFGSVVTASLDYETWRPCPSLSTQQLSFQLRDRDGNILPVPSLSFCLVID